MDSVCCRLCGYNSPDLVEIFGEQGVAADYARKIGRYLYLLVTPIDDLPKSLCWMCSQQLDSFHRFHEKIHEIQQRILQERYPEYAIEMHHKYVEDGEIEIFEEPVEEEENALAETDQPESQEEVQIIESESQAPKSHDADDELSIELIPNSNSKNSFLVVKAEQAVETLQQLRIHNVEMRVPGVDVFEIRKSNRKNRTSEQRRKNASRNQYDSENDEEQIMVQQKTKTDNRLNLNSEDETHKKSPKESRVVLRKSTRKKNQNVNVVDFSKEVYEEHVEGESGDEFPARDSDNEEWPAAEIMDKFPTTMIKNGLLTVKGKRLMEMINRFYNLQCDLCEGKSVRFKSVQKLFGHYQSSHQQVGYVTCCQKKIHRFPSIIMHMARHFQPEAFKCDICGYLVTRPRFLITHRQTHLPDDQKPYACEHCPKRFCWKRAYMVHLNTHKSPEDRIVYVCPVCRKQYDSPGGLSAHKRNAHLINDSCTTKVSHFCEICAKTFAHSSGLKEHIASIHQPREKTQVQCTQCSKWLMNARCLKVHMQLHREDDIACDLCDYKTKKNSLLKRHKITQHQSEKPFSCEKCNNSFKHRQALTAHMRVKHNGGGKTSFKCNFCDRSFKSSTNFYTHRKNRHPEELAAMNEQAEALRKLQRIKAGVEPDDIPLVHESTVTTTADGSRIITISGKNYGISDPSGTMIVLNVSKNQATDKDASN